MSAGVLAVESVVAVAKDVQVRQVNGGFVVILVSRGLNADGNSITAGQSEHVVVSGADAGKLIAEFLAS